MESQLYFEQSPFKCHVSLYGLKKLHNLNVHEVRVNQDQSVGLEKAKYFNILNFVIAISCILKSLLQEFSEPSLQNKV